MYWPKFDYKYDDWFTQLFCSMKGVFLILRYKYVPSPQFDVRLQKTSSGSLGLSIVGGRCSRLGDIGVFIKSTVDNTPAANTGKLKPC